MNEAQKRYTTGEQELLSIVETLKEFRNILFGQQIIIHTDHRNILYKKLSSDRIIRWRLLLEEYGPEYVHVKGKDNIIANALSHMDADFNPDSKATVKDHSECAYICAYMMSCLIRDESCETSGGENMRKLHNSVVQSNVHSKFYLPFIRMCLENTVN
jgi:hypothetical protein